MKKLIKVGEWQSKKVSNLAYKLSEHIDKIENYGASVSNPAIETNGILDLRKFFPAVENQLNSSSCVENALVGALEFLKIRNGSPYTLLSRLFLYYNARVLEGDVFKDQGSMVETGFRSLSIFGVPPEQEWEFNLNNLYLKPPPNVYSDALINKIDSYYNINDNDYKSLVKRALCAQHTVIFGMMVGEEYMDYSGGILTPTSNSFQNAGGHCQCICGYNDPQKYWIIRNSWASDWGESGYANVSYDYLDAAQACDFWVPYLPGTSTNNG